MISYGLKISKKGKDARTATGRDLIYNSEENYLFIQKEGLILRSAVTTAIPHGLTYFPTGMLWGDNTSQEYFKANIGDANAPVGLDMTIDNYEANLTHSGSAEGNQLYYIIFNDPVSYG